MRRVHVAISLALTAASLLVFDRPPEPQVRGCPVADHDRSVLVRADGKGRPRGAMWLRR